MLYEINLQKRFFKQCNYCDAYPTKISSYYLVGTFELEKFYCKKCERLFFNTLPVGFSVGNHFSFIDHSGKIENSTSNNWFASKLISEYKNRINSPIKVTVENFKKIKNPIILNCIDSLYGHSLLKLLNAEFHINNDNKYELIVIIPRILRWLVPDGVGEIWTYDLKLSEAALWNEWLAKDVIQKLNSYRKFFISKAPVVPHPSHFNIEKFTKISPYKISNWTNRPTVSYIWREDRLWCDTRSLGTKNHLKIHILKKLLFYDDIKIQNHLVISLFLALKSIFSNLTFNVIGIGQSLKFPKDINDFRKEKLSFSDEKKWCRVYSKSHVVIGIHGSNMLLPSAHSGASISLIPKNRVNNLFQDIITTELDPRMACVRNRCISTSSSIDYITKTIESVIKNLPEIRENFIDNTFLNSASKDVE